MLPTHLSRKFLSFDDRHACFAGQALDHERLARTDRTTEQVALGHRSHIALLPQRDILTEPGFHFFLSVDVIECTAGFDELDQPVAVFLDQLFLQFTRSSVSSTAGSARAF